MAQRQPAGSSSAAKWRDLTVAGSALLLLVAVLLVHSDLEALLPHWRTPLRLGSLLVAAGLGFTCVFFIIRGLFSNARAEVLAWRAAASWMLYILTGLLITSALDVNLSGLLVGGAIIGVVVAVGAQAALGNIFAGMLLVLSRPYSVGSWIRLTNWFTPTSNYEGQVISVGAIYTVVSNRGRLVRIPNSTAITAVLVTGQPPTVIDINVTVSSSEPIDRLADSIRKALELVAGDELELIPQSLDRSDGGSLQCHLVVRSHAALSGAAISRALSSLVAG